MRASACILVPLLLAAGLHAQHPRVAWGPDDRGLRIGLVSAQGSDVFASVLAENVGSNALVVVRTPGMKGLRLVFRAAHGPGLEQSFDFEAEFRSASERSPIAPGRLHDEIVRLEPGRTIILQPVSASVLRAPALRQLKPGTYTITALFEWNSVYGSLANTAGAWNGSVRSGPIRIRLPQRRERVQRPGRRN